MTGLIYEGQLVAENSMTPYPERRMLTRLESQRLHLGRIFARSGWWHFISGQSVLTFYCSRRRWPSGCTKVSTESGVRSGVLENPVRLAGWLYMCFHACWFTQQASQIVNPSRTV